MLFLREDPHIVIGSRTLSDVRLLMRGPGTDSEAPEGHQKSWGHFGVEPNDM
jgi:hypothetical protein